MIKSAKIIGTGMATRELIGIWLIKVSVVIAFVGAGIGIGIVHVVLILVVLIVSKVALNIKKKRINKFNNFRKLFTIKNFAILFITIALSFSARCIIISYFTLDITQFYDFCFVGLLVSVIRPLITDLFDIFKNHFKPSVCLCQASDDDVLLEYLKAGNKCEIIIQDYRKLSLKVGNKYKITDENVEKRFLDPELIPKLLETDKVYTILVEDRKSLDGCKEYTVLV